MIRLFGCVVTALMVAAVAARAEPVTKIVSFPVTEFSGETTQLWATLTRPDGDGPFPAVVLLHGCSGAYPPLPWAEANLAPLGYAALRIDSFGSRGVAGICDGQDRYVASPAVRALDAHAGKTFLAGLPDIDGDAIGVIGWSHGGTVALAAAENVVTTQTETQSPFKAAIAFYPGCAESLSQLPTPLLVLIGGADDWTTAARCEAMTLETATTNDYELVIYPGAAHGFDIEGLSREYAGHTLQFDPDATADAYTRMAAFLALHLQ